MFEIETRKIHKVESKDVKAILDALDSNNESIIRIRKVENEQEV
jgi:hypothetical protein